MPSLVLDTHAAIWYLETSPRLSTTAEAAIRSAITGGDPVWISSVTAVELIYLVEKRRFPSSLLDQLIDLLGRPASGYRVAPFDLACAAALRGVSNAIRDMPDRMIAATAVTLGLPLVTRDARIRACGISVIW